VTDPRTAKSSPRQSSKKRTHFIPRALMTRVQLPPATPPHERRPPGGGASPEEKNPEPGPPLQTPDTAQCSPSKSEE